jgi:hypothetical protein
MATSVKRPRARPRTGLNALKARVKVRGLQAIDHRTAAARSLLAWRKDLLDDLGGPAAVSAAQLALVEVATRTKLYVDHVDAVLLERAHLTTKHRNRLIPLVEQRERLAAGLVRTLQALGLERRGRPVQSLTEYLAQKTGGRDGLAADGAPPNNQAPSPGGDDGQHHDDDHRRDG